MFDFGGRDSPPEWLPNPLGRSWDRCRRAGLQRQCQAPLEPMPAGELQQLLERDEQLVGIARKELHTLSRALLGSGNVAFVTDDLGFVVAVDGDLEHAGSVLGRLRCGVNVSEPVFGTNAAGTVLVERQPAQVRRGEHFLAQLGALECFAAPILDPRGKLLGALTVSGSGRPQLPGVPELAQVAVARMERRLVCRVESPYLLRMHPHFEAIGTASEGLVAIGDGGEVMGLNSAAASMLGMTAEALAGRHLDLAFESNPLRMPALNMGRTTVLRVRNGLGLSGNLVSGTDLETELENGGEQRRSPRHPRSDLRFVETFSPRELQVLRQLELGLSNIAIAQRLHISLDTVKYHLKNIFSKLQANSRVEAIRNCRQLGVLAQASADLP